MMHYIEYVRRICDCGQMLSDQVRDLEGELRPRSFGSVLLEERPGLGGRHRAHGEKLVIHSTMVEDAEVEIGLEINISELEYRLEGHVRNFSQFRQACRLGIRQLRACLSNSDTAAALDSANSLLSPSYSYCTNVQLSLFVTLDHPEAVLCFASAASIPLV